MNKQTKLWLGVGAIGVAAYLIWKQTQEKKAFLGFKKRERNLGNLEIIETKPTFETPRPLSGLFGQSTFAAPQEWVPGGCKVAIACTNTPNGKIYTCKGFDKRGVRNISDSFLAKDSSFIDCPEK